MSKLTMLVAVALSLTACGKKKQSAGSAEAITKLTEFKTRSCACNDATCIQGVVVDYQKWTEAFYAAKKADDPMSPEDEKQIDALNAATKVCIDKLGAAGSAAPPPGTHAAEGDDSAEAQLVLTKLGKNAKTYFATNATYPQGKSATLPDGDCCKVKGGKCAVTDAWAKDPMWATLDMQIDEPNRFHYTYESADGKSFTATAVGDPTCDVVDPITVTLTGTIENGNPKVENPKVEVKRP